MNKASKDIHVRSIGLLLLSLLTFFLFSALSFAAEISELEKYKGKEYGPEYFFAIQGEVSGQAAPGVQAVYVNDKPVQIDKDLNFNTKVNLKDGQKYLTIETRYKGLRFIKKYLVIRHPTAPKTFKIHVPKKEFQEIIAKAKPVPKKRMKIIKKPEPKPKTSFGFKAREFQGPYTIKALAQAIEADAYEIKTAEPAGSLKWLNEILRTPNFYDIWKTKKKNVFMTEEMLRLIRETSGYRHKPFAKLTRLQQLKIIRLNRLLIEATYPLLTPKSLAEGVVAEDENWLGFELVAELEPEKLLVVRRINGKYFALIYHAKSKAWVPLHEISLKEFKDLLERNQLPPSFNS